MSRTPWRRRLLWLLASFVCITLSIAFAETVLLYLWLPALILFSLVIFAIFAGWGGFVLSLFGDYYAEGTMVLVLLAFGLLFDAATGPSCAQPSAFSV